MNLQKTSDLGGALSPPKTPLNVIDHALCMALSNPSFYRGGWGEPAVIEQVLAVAAEPPAPELPAVRWIDLPETSGGITRMSGFFESPARMLPLPAESRAAYFELLLPEGSSPALRPPVCLYLAATAEQGYALRRQFAGPLIRRGVGALILENPYYGRRRPATQQLAALETVADQIVMNTATVLEARALLRWLREGGFGHTGVSGFSMGGFMASYVAAFTEFPIALIPCLAGASASMAYSAFPFAHFPAWSSLGDPVEARAKLAELFDVFSIERYPLPVAPDLVQLVAARSDAVIVPENVRRLARHWGVPIRWIPGGHFSSVVRGRSQLHGAILDAFGMMLAR